VTTSCASAGGVGVGTGDGVAVGWIGVTSFSDGGSGVREGGSGVLLPPPIEPLEDGGGGGGAGVAAGGAAVEVGAGVAVGVGWASSSHRFLSQSLIAALTASRKSGKSASNSSLIDCSVRLSALRECLQLSIRPSRR
jgi:hypothetical protein